MTTLNVQIREYLHFCNVQKKLSPNTMRAYQVDMKQFLAFMSSHYKSIQAAADVTKSVIQDYIRTLAELYAIRTSKRKVACVKAFFSHLEYEDIIVVNPFRKIRLPFKEEKELPKTMHISEMRQQFEFIYSEQKKAKTTYKVYMTRRDVACYELLYSTGMRVGELCGLHRDSINFTTGSVRIMGKGRKERVVYIISPKVMDALNAYMELRDVRPCSAPNLFLNWNGRRMSEDSVRRRVLFVGFHISQRRITPHMFRHTFATMLLENMVDIRFIQELLGHSSIKTTQIYLHLTNTAIRAALEKGSLRERLGLGDCLVE